MEFLTPIDKIWTNSYCQKRQLETTNTSRETSSTKSISYFITSSFFLFVNNNPHWPSIFSDNLCKFGWISSDSVRPNAWAITLFFPKRNLEWSVTLFNRSGTQNRNITEQATCSLVAADVSPAIFPHHSYILQFTIAYVISMEDEYMLELFDCFLNFFYHILLQVNAFLLRFG